MPQTRVARRGSGVIFRLSEAVMKNHFRGATPELLAKALFSKSAAKRKLRMKPKADPRRRSTVQSSA